MMLPLISITVAQNTDDAARSQFFAAVAAKRYAEAVTVGKTYATTHPDDDNFALNLAYAEINAGNRSDATGLLRRLADSSNATVAAQARKQLDAMTGLSSSTPGAAPAIAPGYLYAYAQNESRFGDNFGGLNGRYDLAHGAIVPFIGINASYDTRSGAPGLAQVFNTDEIFTSVGARAPLGTAGFGYLYAQGGYGVGLRGQASAFESRYGLAYSRDYGSLFADTPHTQIGASAAVYSRFAGNAIAYGQASYDARLTRSVRVIVGTNIGLDGQRLFFNNFAEAYAGIAVPLTPTTSLRIVGVDGSYLGRGIARPATTSYTSIRTLLVFGSGLP